MRTREEPKQTLYSTPGNTMIKAENKLEECTNCGSKEFFETELRTTYRKRRKPDTKVEKFRCKCSFCGFEDRAIIEYK